MKTDTFIYSFACSCLMCGAYGTSDEYGCDNNVFFFLHYYFHSSSFLASFSCRSKQHLVSVPETQKNHTKSSEQ